MTIKKIRIDKYLVLNKKVETRNKANDLINKQKVLVNNIVVIKPSFLVTESDLVEILEHDNYVSRGAYKLLHALDYYKLNVKDLICLDIGCSTGGFSQVLLQRYCKLIYAIDVGENQFSPELFKDKRIKLFENQHFLHIKQEFFQEKIDFICCDVSFISATKMIKHVAEIVKNKFQMILLIKPQYELDKKTVDKYRGLIKDKKLHNLAINKIIMEIKNNNLVHGDVIESPILGAKKENKEFLIWIERK